MVDGLLGICANTFSGVAFPHITVEGSACSFGDAIFPGPK